MSRYRVACLVVLGLLFDATHSMAEPSPKVVELDPTLAVHDFLKTASIEVTSRTTAPPELTIDIEKIDDQTFDNRVDFSWGVALTSNYVSGGVTQSDDKPAFQAWGEMASDFAYAGIWLSTIDIEPDNWEFELTFGIRPTFGELALDLGYARTVYDITGDCCGEWVAAAEYAMDDRVTLGGSFDWDPQSDDRSASAGLIVAMTESLEFSAEMTRDIVSHDNDWEAGLTWSFTDSLALDARYYDSDFADPIFVLTMIWEGGTAR